MSHCITRIGVYGILLENSVVILTQKTTGPYKGLLDLPGGGIEFGEKIHEALAREIQEELAMSFSEAVWYDNLSFYGEFGASTFHHIGLIYFIRNFKKIERAIPQETSLWLPLEKIDEEELTPFANEVMRRITAV